MSAMLVETLLARGPCLLIVVDGDWKVREASQALADLLDRPRASLGDTPFVELLHPRFPPVRESLVALLHEEGVQAELALGAEDVPPRWVAFQSTMLPDGSMALLGHEPEVRAAQTEELAFGQLVDLFPGVFWVADLELRAMAVVGGGRPFRNRIREAFLGRTVYEYFGTEDPSFGPIAAHLRALEGEVGEYEFETEGQYYRARVQPRRDDADNVVGVVGVATEVTSPRLVEERLRPAQREQALGRLAGAMAHEFNNLLTVIAAHADLMEEQLEGDPGALEDLAAIRSAAGKGSTMTSRLLSFTSRRIQQPERVCPARLVRDLEPALRALANDRFFRIVVKDERWVRIDPALLEQVLVNLLDNAVRATEPGGRVALSVLPGDEAIEIVVRDEGRGMTDAVRARAGEPFFTTRGPGEGGGLGLTTAYAIVREAGGELALESAPDAGTTATIRLPRTRAPSGSLLKAQPACDETVLLVEDQLGVRRATRRLLRRAGYRVFEAASGDEALALVTGYPGPIDLLLTDVVMPEMSGPRLAELLLEHRPTLRVLYMSGFAADVEEVRRALGRGQTFLAKPFTPEQLFKRVRVALGDDLDDDEELAAT